jgi:hypothetical protein
MPWIIGILVAWVGFSLAWSTRRWVWKLLYKFNIWQRITAVEQPNAEWQDAARLTWEFTEYSQRRQAIDLARIVFQWNDDISQSLSKPAFELFIDARIQDVRWGAPVEQSFWRNMHNIINQRWRLAQAGDIIIKPYYFDKRSDIIWDLENAARIRTETIDFFTNGNGKTEIESIRAFMELDHDVLNETELRTRDRFDVVRTDLLWGNLHFLFWMNLDQAKVEVRRRIAAPILEGRTNPPSIDSIVGNWSHANPGEWGRLVKNEVTNFAFITDITQYEQTLTSRMLDARLNWEEYNSNAVRGQLQSFFASIWREWW